MKKELDKQLQLRFKWLEQPVLERERDYEFVPGYSNYENYGFDEVCDGWYELLVKMFTEIEELYKKENIEPDYKISQIKSKFGVLKVYGGRRGSEPDIHAIDFLGLGSIRFYPEEKDPLTKALNDIIKKYEELSKTTCENCGAGNAELRTEKPYFSWVSTLCPSCSNERIQSFKKHKEKLAGKKKEDFIG